MRSSCYLFFCRSWLTFVVATRVSRAPQVAARRPIPRQYVVRGSWATPIKPSVLNTYHLGQKTNIDFEQQTEFNPG